MKIGVLGPKGTFSEKAARHWNSSAEIVFYDTISDAVEAVELGESDVCVVPIENSLEGSINITLDLLLKNKLPIVGEVVIHVGHCLLLKGDRDDVTMICSNPTALAQCREYIKNSFPNAKIYSATSTAEAAQKASLVKHIAAIASREAAIEYKLKIFAAGIQDANENYTRFVVIGREESAPTSNDKTSIIVFPKENKPAELYRILGVFAEKGIDLTKVESRTTKKTLGDYLFYIDLKGHIKDEIIAKALAELALKVQSVKILGSYPVAKINGA